MRREYLLKFLQVLTPGAIFSLAISIVAIFRTGKAEEYTWYTAFWVFIAFFVVAVLRILFELAIARVKERKQHTSGINGVSGGFLLYPNKTNSNMMQSVLQQMNWRLFFLRRWDDVIHLVDMHQGARFRPPPKPVHEPLTTKEMKTRIQDSIESMLHAEGFAFDEVWDNGLWWARPQYSIGQQVIGLGFCTKYAPDVLGVHLSVGYSSAFLKNAVEEICGPLVIAGQRQKSFLALTGLERLYLDPRRPKRRPSVPEQFMFWNTDFRSSEVDEIKNVIRRFALPYFNQIKSADDLVVLAKSVESQAILLASLGKADSALQLLGNELGRPQRHGPEMRARLECLRSSIENGVLQGRLAERK